MKNSNKDPLGTLRGQLLQAIERDFKTVEEFCWAKDLNKATVSNFLRSKKDFRVSTLANIAEALAKKLIIRLE